MRSINKENLASIKDGRRNWNKEWNFENSIRNGGNKIRLSLIGNNITLINKNYIEINKKLKPSESIWLN